MRIAAETGSSLLTEAQPAMFPAEPMDFEHVLRDLVPYYAMIGGFALGVLGIPRATMALLR